MGKLYWKIAWRFLLLILLLGAIQLHVHNTFFLGYVQESEQRLQWGLAQEIADELRPFFSPPVYANGLKDAFYRIAQRYPKVDVYVIDHSGMLLASFVDQSALKSSGVDVEPIRSFVESRAPELPLYGVDPRSGKQDVVFSAAEAEFGNTPAYVYAVLGKGPYSSALAALRSRYSAKRELVWLVVVLAVTVAVGWRIHALLTVRFREMIRMLREFAAGDYRIRAAVGGSDELTEVAAAVNQMADTIQATIGEQQKMDELRRQLVANVSHDLRAPIASLQGYLESILMRHDAMSEVERKEYIASALHSADSLSNLVTELFELSKLEARDRAPNLELFSLAELAQDTVLMHKANADDRSVDLRLEVDNKVQPVHADISMMERVFTNLLSNALHYTDAGGSITVHLAQNGSAVQVDISDTGQGIAAEHLPHIFDRFYRGDKSRSRKTGGAGGLGLAIVKKILELHGSTVRVESEFGKGTTFSFEVPNQPPEITV